MEQGRERRSLRLARDTVTVHRALAVTALPPLLLSPPILSTMAADARALLRAAAAASQRVDHPAAAYSADGALSCRVCQCRVPSAAQWPPHLASQAHAQHLRQLRESASATAAATAAAPPPPPPPPAPAAAAGAPAALPAGFYDDARRDEEARGIDWRAAEKAAQEGEVAAFLGWASDVAREGEAQEAREEERYVERGEDAAAEAALGRARVAVLKDLVSEGRAVGAELAGGGEGGSGSGSGSGSSGGGGGAALLADAEALPLAAPPAEGGVTVQELAALLAAARKRPRAAAEGEGKGAAEEEEEEEDLLDWRGGFKRRGGQR